MYNEPGVNFFRVNLIDLCSGIRQIGLKSIRAQCNLVRFSGRVEEKRMELDCSPPFLPKRKEKKDGSRIERDEQKGREMNRRGEN